jgi:hypothetical protein
LRLCASITEHATAPDAGFGIENNRVVQKPAGFLNKSNFLKRRKTMKKKTIIVLAFIGLAVLLFSACGNETTSGGGPGIGTTAAVFTSLTADGSATATTTKLTLTFDKDITGLNAADITLDSGSTGAVKGSLTRTGTGVYELAVAGITAGGSVSVAASKSGYTITGGAKTITVYRYTAPTDIAAAFTNLTADGSDTATTTKLTLTFDKDITGLSAADIALDSGSTGAVKGSLTRTGTGVYELAVAGITAGGSVTVAAVSRPGYNITGWPKSVTVYCYVSPTDIAAAFTNLTADGSDTATTTKLTLTFDKDIAELSAEDITLDDGSTGAVKGSLTRTGTGVYELAVSGITAGGSVTVAVSKPGYNITGGAKTVTVYCYIVPVNTYSVNYNANGGTGTMEQSTFTRGAAHTLPPNTFTRSDHVFSGWALTAGGVAAYADCAGVTDLAAAGGSVTLYAVWEVATLVPGASLGAQLNWLEANAERDMKYIVEVRNPESISPRSLSYGGKTNITIHLKGVGGMKTVGLVSNGSLFTVGSGITLVLDGNITLQGRDGNTAPLVMVNNGGTFIMNPETKITGNTASANGGGVSVSGIFTMNGGEISGNASSSYGGGVYVANNGTFTKSGGTITGYADDTVTGNVVKNNAGVVQNNRGHAVYVSSERRRESTAGPEVNLNSGVLGSWLAAVVLTADTWADGNIPLSDGEQWFRFTANAGTQYLYASFGTLTRLYVQVYDGGGATVGSQTNLSGSTTYTTRTLTAGQEYYIRVTPYSSSYSGTYRILFGNLTINIASIAGLTAPVSGLKPVTGITENAQYSGTVSWSPAVSGTFAKSVVYTATITLSAKTGYTLQGVAANFFTVSGAATVSNSANSGVITAVFPPAAIGFEMVYVSGGSFQMGKELGTNGNGDCTPVHTVTLSGFYMGKYQVTQAQYQAVMGSNPSYFYSSPASGEVQGNRPVEWVSWYDAIVFCNKLSIAEGLTPAYRISGSTNPSDWGTVPTSSNSTWNAAVIVSGSTGYRLPTGACRKTPVFEPQFYIYSEIETLFP